MHCMWLMLLSSPPADVVIYNHLKVLICGNLCPSAVVPRVNVWVDVDDFAVPFVLEEQTSCFICQHLHVQDR